jgi:hypothetical protein
MDAYNYIATANAIPDGRNLLDLGYRADNSARIPPNRAPPRQNNSTLAPTLPPLMNLAILTHIYRRKK